MKQEILNRKGARKVMDIPDEVLDLLNHGKIETVNLTEWLAVDHVELINNNLTHIVIPENVSSQLIEKIKKQKAPTTMNTIRLVGASLYDYLQGKKELDTAREILTHHTSDSIRCYAPFLTGLDQQLSISQKLHQAQALVADKHFGVREIVWMALRPEIDLNLEQAIEILSGWTSSKDENIRRFTTESIRPRGVWCKHIERLKTEPELALPVLEKLKADPSKYVQGSVGNWLNDASKTSPDFVEHLCERWQSESADKNTEKIIRKALRTLNKG
ncbi:DNA alkylation repair protein [Pseudobacter ginsenosidimutans]|uniref:3-methyladenine DNA glycosylase AlkC n=1 Tax=Pseudobacter ginsenosidimutans TaxID=661488 RepID=A0A4Q7N5L5_9BACT|nr:DNA alkylation repair protein [Pseudobacter ginsenosidimutans]QEC44829.1 DNA alkylation repair protein [Pseudobacter ginsenosidimutans]RZS76319.1 3-methyladenine DNA glycosylase AlkC [Pseudobacter ginsenosidimutans]